MASIFAQSADEEAILLVASSDHFIPDTIEFHRVIGVGLHQLENGQMVTFVIKSNRPETGYGYLKIDCNVLNRFGTVSIASFVEKSNFT